MFIPWLEMVPINQISIFFKRIDGHQGIRMFDGRAKISYCECFSYSDGKARKINAQVICETCMSAFYF